MSGKQAECGIKNLLARLFAVFGTGMLMAGRIFSCKNLAASIRVFDPGHLAPTGQYLFDQLFAFGVEPVFQIQGKMPGARRISSA